MARLTCALKTSQQRGPTWTGGKIAVFDLIRESRRRTIAIEGLDFRQRPKYLSSPEWTRRVRLWAHRAGNHLPCHPIRLSHRVFAGPSRTFQYKMSRDN